MYLTHWGWVTHICVSKLTIIGSDNGLSPGRRQAIIRTNAGILLIEPLGTNFNEILIEIHTFSFKKMHLKLSFGEYWPSCLGLNVLITLWLGSKLTPNTLVLSITKPIQIPKQPRTQQYILVCYDMVYHNFVFSTTEQWQM